MSIVKFAGMRLRSRRAGALVFALALVAQVSMGQIVATDVNRPDETGPKTTILPYAFRTETFDTSIGIFGVVSRWPEEHSAVYATAFGSANGSWRAWIGAFDLSVPGTERWFLKPDLMGSDYKNFQVYIDGNPEFPDVRAGSNDSDPLDFVEDSGWDGMMKLSFRYVLPIAHGKVNIINHVSVDKGVRASAPVGGLSWNPLKSGRSYLFVEPFFRNQELELDDGDRRLNMATLANFARGSIFTTLCKY